MMQILNKPLVFLASSFASKQTHHVATYSETEHKSSYEGKHQNRHVPRKTIDSRRPVTLFAISRPVKTILRARNNRWLTRRG